MRIAKTSLGSFVIERGESTARPQGFVLFVDDFRSAWTSKLAGAQKFRTEEEAELVIREIRRRNKYRKYQRLERGCSRCGESKVEG